jgi:hypothetical protein
MVTQPTTAQGRLMDQLKRQARLDPIPRLAAPAAEQIPGSQPQMFGDQHP